MKNIFTLPLFLILSSSIALGQLNITDADYPPNSPLNCANYSNVGNVNFFDDGGGGANYGSNRNDVFTVCPDITYGTPKISAAFGIGQGLTWDVHSSDTLFVYDGPNTNAPLLGAYNSSNAPNGFGHVASWQNTSGCLTFAFVSDGANEGTGWGANISCISPEQDIEMHIEAFINGTPGNDMFPIDTGYIDLCQGDSVLLVAKPIFPYSFENTGSGYSQTLNNVTYDWGFSDGTVGVNNDSVWYKPNSATGVFVTLMITDAFPHNTSTRCRIRVSTTPLFTGTGPLDDTVCFNQSTELLGGVTPSDTVGVDIPQNSFQLGGNFAGLTFLPDGSNAEYMTAIHISGFDPATMVTSPSDVLKVCVNMEHSFLGDLEMWLECPDGTLVTVFNSYGPGGSLPGGFQGGNVFLGEPNDVSNGGEPPGNGYEYCFSSSINTWGPFATEYMTNTIPTPPTAPSPGLTMDPNGIYQPEVSFGNFSGCPINGDWTLHIKDNWALDDGYIFGWGIYFDPALYPDNEYYTNTVSDAFWSPDPTIISGNTGDTLVVIKPNATGTHSYTFNIIDDFGCPYDTIVSLLVLDTTINVMSLDTSLFCFSDSIPLWVNATGSVPPFSFLWGDGQVGDTAIYEMFQNGVENHIITVTDGCGMETKDTATITMNQTLSIDSLQQNPADCGIDNGSVVSFISGVTGSPKHTWSGPGADSPNQTNSSAWLDKPPGWYYYTVNDLVCSVTDSILLLQNPPPKASITALPSSGVSPLNVTFINSSEPATSYVWNFGVGNDTTVHNLSDQYATYIEAGVHTIILTAIEGNCIDKDSVTVIVILPTEYDMPNVFTPNGDGANDYFTINAKNALGLEVVILNRWGNVVFESSDINFKWNGKINNTGAEVEDGTYFYKFIITNHNGEKIKEHGFVQLVKDK